MSKGRSRRFSRGFKLKAVERLQAGESGSALALELSVKRTILYRWRDAYRLGGVEALRDRFGRPTKAEALAMAKARSQPSRLSGASGGQGEAAGCIGEQTVNDNRRIVKDRADSGAFGDRRRPAT